MALPAEAVSGDLYTPWIQAYRGIGANRFGITIRKSHLNGVRFLVYRLLADARGHPDEDRRTIAAQLARFILDLRRDLAQTLTRGARDYRIDRAAGWERIAGLLPRELRRQIPPDEERCCTSGSVARSREARSGA
jgi:hypothetical protein